MNFKSVLPHILVVAVFFLLTVVVYHPSFLDGKSLSQHDILQATGANKQLQDFRVETGEEGLWLHTMFSGMPAYLAGVQYSGDFLNYAYKAIRLGLSHPTGITFLSFLSFYIMLLAFGVRQWLAVAGAVLFGLNGFNIISIAAGHNAKIAAVALMPLVIAGIRLTFSERRWFGVGLTALALGLQIRANHPQITYYLLLMVLVYGAFELFHAIKEKQLKDFGINVGALCVAALLAVAANSGKLYHIYEYGKWSTRGASELSAAKTEAGLDYEYAFRFSNGITEPMVMFFPNFKGGSSQQKLSDDSNTAKALMQTAGYNRVQASQTVQSMPTYFGDQPLTAPYYAGSVLLLLVIVGLVALPRKQSMWLLVIAVLGIMMSWGKNFAGFNNLLFDLLPGYNKFRSVTFTIILPILAFNLLAFLGVEKFFTADNKERWRILKWSALVSGGICLLMLLASGMMSYRGAVDAQMPEWLVDALRDDRKYLFRKDVFRGLIYTSIGVGILWTVHKEKLKMAVAAMLLAGITILDVLPLSKRFLNEDNFSNDPSEEFFAENDADRFIKQNSRPGDRVLNLQNPWNEARTSYHHESIGGYHGAKLRRYDELRDAYLFDQANEVISKLQSGSRDMSDLQVLNMLNPRFLVFGPQTDNVLTNTHALGRAWIVNDIKTVGSPQEALDALGQTNLKTTAVINTREFADVKSGGQGTISLESKTPNKLVYKANISSGTALGVFSEIYYAKGWQVSIDGQSARLLRANFILRALEIPEGNHEIVMEFKPASYARMNGLMMISSILILLGFAAATFLEIRKSSASS